MRSYVGIALVAGIAGLAFVACSAGENAQATSGPSVGTGAGGFGASEDAGIDAMFGMGGGGQAAGQFTFAEACGMGCIPETGRASARRCDPEPRGGGGGMGGSDDVFDCVLSVDDEGIVAGSCSATGEAVINQPCLSSSDCAPGLGCVEDGVCRPYCCGDVEACPEGSFCALRSPSETDTPATADDVELPVCALASNCTLLDGSCGPDLTCTIVRVDGTTSCVEPGEGMIGQTCPCAADHVCNTQQNACHKLCKLGDAADCPQTHYCQAGGAIYPQGFGICISQ